MQNIEDYILLLHPPVNDWIKAFNAHDLDAIVALYTEDAELFDSGMKRPRRGRKEIRRWFSTRFSSMPSINYMPTGQVFIQDEQVALTWTTRGRGPRLLGRAWLARPFQVEGVSVFLFRDGLIQKQRGYYDHLSAIEQILPPIKWILPFRL
jgi:steroid delta-isomerase-like uncharacterized protein